MPSSEATKYCVTVMFSASKKAGADLIWSSCPSDWPSKVPRISRDGVSNPLESRKNSSPVSSAETMTVLVASGMPGTGVRRQLPGDDRKLGEPERSGSSPMEPGLTISTRLATSASVTISRRSRVHA